MANTKMTKKDNFAMVKGIIVGAPNLKLEEKKALADFIDHEIELLDKKFSKSKAKTKKTYVAILDAIKAVLADQTKPVTITEMMTDERLASYEEEGKDGAVTVAMTNQKLSSMVKKLVDIGEVIRTEEKKKAYFSLPKAEEEEPAEDEGENETENE